MDDAEPNADSIPHFLCIIGSDIEVVVYGGESRSGLARRIIDHRNVISGQALRLLKAFMRDTGAFNLSSIEVFSKENRDGGDFLLYYNFTADSDVNKYNYTYFQVYFSCREPPQQPFWPYKFTVGFH